MKNSSGKAVAKQGIKRVNHSHIGEGPVEQVEHNPQHRSDEYPLSHTDTA